MVTEIVLGQSWAVWVSSRQQWLLAKVIRYKDAEVVLKYDSGYGIAGGHDERRVDENALLNAGSLYRLVPAKA